MGCLILLILLVILFGAGSVIAVGFTIGLLLTLIVAGLIGWAADLVVPRGALPGGWLGAVLTGIIGGFVGIFFNIPGMNRSRTGGPAPSGDPPQPTSRAPPIARKPLARPEIVPIMPPASTHTPRVLTNF